MYYKNVQTKEMLRLDHSKGKLLLPFSQQRANSKGSESVSGRGTQLACGCGRRQRQLQRQRWQKQHGGPILALIRVAAAAAGEARPPNQRTPSLLSPSTFGAHAGPQLRSAQTQGRSCRLC